MCGRRKTERFDVIEFCLVYFVDGDMSLKMDTDENNEVADLLIAFASYQLYANEVANQIIEMTHEDEVMEKRAAFKIIN